MKRIALFLGTAALAALSGCATKEYVRSQMDPLTGRVCKIEENESRLSGLREADGAAIKQADDKAQKALDLATKTAGDQARTANEIGKAEAAALKAEAAAMKAEQAAANAEKAAAEAARAAQEAREMAMKSEKIFKLGQKK